MTFYSLSLEKSSHALTSFTLPFKNAQYSWARMPQGLKGASVQTLKNQTYVSGLYCHKNQFPCAKLGDGQASVEWVWVVTFFVGLE